jgi:hypothetical protein
LLFLLLLKPGGHRQLFIRFLFAPHASQSEAKIVVSFLERIVLADGLLQRG